MSILTLALAFWQAHAAMPPPPVPPGNPITPAKAVLGKILFWDEQLSSDNTVACGTCHLPDFAGSDPRPGTHPGPDASFGTPDDIFGSAGVPLMSPAIVPIVAPFFGLDPQVTERSSPLLFANQYGPTQFWDGRAGSAFVTSTVVLPFNASLENQALGPLTNDVEMGHQGRVLADVVAKLGVITPMELSPVLTPGIAAALAGSPTYPALFQMAFGSPAITDARIAMAIATYERTLIPNQTPWDQFMAGSTTAMTPQEVAGWNAFNTSACATCHRPPLFTDNAFHNIGVRPPAEDLGLMNTTGLFSDRGKFKTPSLRNTGLKIEYMHQGGYTNLGQVLNHYQALGPVPFPDNLSGALPIALPPPDVPLIIQFLQNALTDPRTASNSPPFDRPGLHARVNACSDGIDNDGDGVIDGADGGCATPLDTSEHDHFIICDDGIDNDGDGLTDGLDPSCDL